MIFAILSEAKNLIISTELTIEILRLQPQNDITTQPRGERTYYFQGSWAPAEALAQAGMPFWQGDIDLKIRFRKGGSG